MEIAVFWEMTTLYIRHIKRIERSAYGGGRLRLNVEYRAFQPRMQQSLVIKQIVPVTVQDYVIKMNNGGILYHASYFRNLNDLSPIHN
jgi:hypothetical protein